MRGRSGRWLYPLLLVLLAIWLHRFWWTYAETGLFRVIGLDWALYAAQARVLLAGQAGRIYDLPSLDAALQGFRPYTTDPAEPLASGPVPYPPIFAALMVPFAVPSPPVGFAAWTLLNLAAVAYLARRLADVLPGRAWLQLLLVLLVSVPVAQGLSVGQPTALLGCALAESFVSFRAGRELRAGLWLAVLLLKPQYGILLGPVLLAKRRWAAVLGVSLGGLAILAVSVVVVGVPGVLSYTAALSDDAPFRGGAMTNPGQMINWRALILAVRPSIGPETGLGLTLLLGLATVMAVLPVWRGPWSPKAAAFPLQFSATLLATLLAGYHSHFHGATLAALPLAASLGAAVTGRLTRRSILALVFAPPVLILGLDHDVVRTIILHQPREVLIWSPLVQALQVLALVGLVRDVVRQRGQAVQATAPTAGETTGVHRRRDDRRTPRPARLEPPLSRRAAAARATHVRDSSTVGWPGSSDAGSAAWASVTATGGQ